MSRLSIAVSVTPCAAIERVTEDAQRLADALGITVEFRFNDVKCLAFPGGSSIALAGNQQAEQGRPAQPWGKLAVNLERPQPKATGETQ